MLFVSRFSLLEADSFRSFVSIERCHEWDNPCHTITMTKARSYKEQDEHIRQHEIGSIAQESVQNPRNNGDTHLMFVPLLSHKRCVLGTDWSGLVGKLHAKRPPSPFYWLSFISYKQGNGTFSLWLFCVSRDDRDDDSWNWSILVDAIRGTEWSGVMGKLRETATEIVKAATPVDSTGFLQ